MSLFKFHDSNVKQISTHPTVVATADTYNGNQFKIVANEAVPFATDAEAKAIDIYMMNNIIDKPEILNTDSYKVIDGENIRAYRLKDFTGQKIDISQDLVYFAETGVLQQETATVVGTIGVDGAGNATVIVI